VTARAENAALISGVGRAVGPLTFENVSLTLTVLGNATCRKGRVGSASGCTDYRPIRYPNQVVLGKSAGLRIEGAGTATFHNVTVRLAPPGHGPPPAYWVAAGCVDHASLPQSLDPLPQTFALHGNPIVCHRIHQ